MSFGFGESIPKPSRGPDYYIMAFAGILTLFGIALLASASSDLGINQFNDSYYFLSRQLYQGLGLGLVGFFICSHLYYGFFSKKYIALLLLGVTVITLLLVFTPLGISANGATRRQIFECQIVLNHKRRRRRSLRKLHRLRKNNRDRVFIHCFRIHDGWSRSGKYRLQNHYLRKP
jgi:hypothetical protein